MRHLWGETAIFMAYEDKQERMTGLIMKKTTKTSIDHTVLCLDALTFIMTQDNLRDRFISLTGVDADMLKTALESASLHEAVLGFLTGHEPYLLRFCTDFGYAPDMVADHYVRLQGDVYWT